MALGFMAAGAQALQAESCLLQPSRVIELSSPVTGVVARRSVERGDLVERGQTLFELDSRQERAAIAVAQARLEYAKRRIERNQTLVSQNMLAAQEQDELETEQALAQLELNQANTQAVLKRIKSPIAGRVVALDADLGEYVGAEPMATLVTLNPLHAELVFLVEQLGQITVGQALSIEVQNQTRSLSGTVRRIDPLVDPSSGTFGVTVEVANEQGNIPAGLRCRLAAN